MVAVFIAFMAVFIACADVVALEAAAVILVAADDTLVAADDTFVAAAVGVTAPRAVLVVLRAVAPVVFLAAVLFFAPAAFVVRLELAVERRAGDRVVVFVGTDPSPRVDQLRRIHSTIDEDLHTPSPLTCCSLAICQSLGVIATPVGRLRRSPVRGSAPSAASRPGDRAGPALSPADKLV